MNIAYAWTTIKVTFMWVGGFAGIGGILAWIFSFRKVNAEIAKLKLEIQEIKNRDSLAIAKLALYKRANILLQSRNVAILSRAEWASCLDNPNLIDAALLEIGAIRTPGKLDMWEIRFIERRQPQRFRHS